MMTTEKHGGKTFLLLAGVFLFMVFLNIYAPLRGDDFLYSMVWETTKHIESWGDLWQSLVNHYTLHGGRMVTVFFLDLFLWIGKLPFDIANAAVFTGVLILLYFHATRDTKLTAEPGILALAALFMWLSLPHFGEVAVWKSGSTVYLWSGFFVLLFLLPYNLWAAGKLHWGAGMALPMFLAGILGGWSVENFAVTAVLLAWGSVWYARRKETLSAWMGSGAVGVFLGFIGLLAAPGNWARYGEQEHDKGLLIHIGNQFAGNGEMILYLIPVILLLLLMWRILKKERLTEKGETIPEGKSGFTAGQGIAAALILLMAVSYFAGGFLGDSIRDCIINYVLEPLGKAKPKTVYQISHVMEGFEEMAVYWAGIFLIYFKAKKELGFDKAAVKKLNRAVKARDLWDTYPEVRYAGCLIAMAFINNFFILAAPTFPARATFSSSLMVMAAALAVLRVPAVQKAFAGHAGRTLKIGGGAVALFIAAATVVVSVAITRENDTRIAYIASHAGSGKVLEIEPIRIKNRALRHVFYKEFELGRDRDYMMNRYYGIKDVKLIGETKK